MHMQIPRQRSGFTGALVRAQIPTFIDLVGLNHGDSLTAKLGAAIESAVAVIPIVSRSSINSDWVKRELVTCKESGIPLVPFKADDALWLAHLRLVLGDVLYIDAVDTPYAEGLVPKALVNLLSPRQRTEAGWFFPIGSSHSNSPYVQYFPGAVQTAWDELSFGRTAIVLPTNQSVYLGGRATTSILDHLGVDADFLTSERTRIESREISSCEGSTAI